MKTKIKFLVVLLVVFSFTSCEKMTDVNFETTTTDRIDIEVTPTKTGAIAFDEEVVVKLENGSGEIGDYLQHLKKIEVKKLSYKFISFSGDADTVITGKLYLDGTLVNENISINLKQAVDAVSVFEILDAQDLDKMEKSLINNKQITIRFAGEATTSQQLNFKVEATSKLAVTADPI